MATKVWKRAHADQLKAAHREYYGAHAEEYRTYAKAWRQSHRERGLCIACNAPAAPGIAECDKHRTASLANERRRKFGLSPTDVAALLSGQGNACAICSRPFDFARRAAFQIDHDHETGELRGALCTSCNRGLGFFFDDPDLMRRAAEYVESRRSARLEVVN